MAAFQVDTYLKKEIKVDDTTFTMKIGREPVLTVSTFEGRVQLGWLSEGWKNWKELQESAELKQLITTANDSLAKSAAAQPKGKGKGLASADAGLQA